ncbi:MULTISPECIES: ChbG/HpnK family deacetylase [Paenibacillus]|uniref:ChbG/HpnK family deacetylase n=1 Tax=Paenibacillus TaxID=44249 RepID=UPI0035A23FEB
MGLHFNLIYGTPATNPLLVPSPVRAGGSFHGNHAEWRDQDIARELYTRYGRMRKHGLRPTHVDSHHHIIWIIESCILSLKSSCSTKNFLCGCPPVVQTLIFHGSRVNYLCIRTIARQASPAS